MASSKKEVYADALGKIWERRFWDCLAAGCSEIEASARADRAVKCLLPPKKGSL